MFLRQEVNSNLAEIIQQSCFLMPHWKLLNRWKASSETWSMKIDSKSGFKPRETVAFEVKRGVARTTCSKCFRQILHVDVCVSVSVYTSDFCPSLCVHFFFSVCIFPVIIKKLTLCSLNINVCFVVVRVTKNWGFVRRV